MKISTNWINDYVDIKDQDLKELGRKITICGVNVEGVESALDFTNLVVGEVLECYPHRDSDHLNVCKVNTGAETFQIVCGAPNVKKGIKVIVSLPGAILPGGVEIKKSTIRGEESNGMICGLFELGLPGKYEDGIHILNDDAQVGSSPKEYIPSSDTVYTLDLNPNRNDCLSHLGFAYEVASVLKKEVRTPDINFTESKVDVNEKFKLKVETDNVNLIILKLIENIEIKESPDFIKERLLSAGMRSINNVVDISNYVMLEYGQPLHFYDADKLKGTLGVRMAHDNEEVVTLDSKKRVLCCEDMVITDGTDAVGVAGVMGGLDSEVTENTKSILIEAAIFNPFNIRQTSIKLGLRSEASLRFEKPLNPDYCYESVKRSCHLLEKYASANPAKGIVVVDNYSKEPKKASVSLEKINKVIGLELTEADVCDAFDRLGFVYNNEYDVTIPNRRTDVSIPEDLIEEVGRMYGFHNIKGTFPVQESKKGGYAPRIKYRKDISKKMRALGLDEVRTYTLTNEDNSKNYNLTGEESVVLSRPISKVKTHLRTSLIPSLLEVYDYNKSHNLTNLNVYEISNIYTKIKDEEYNERMNLAIMVTGEYLTNKWQKVSVKSDFYILKGIVENLLHYLDFGKRTKYSIENLPSFMHPKASANILVDNEVVGVYGRIHPNIKKQEIYVCQIDLDKLLSKETKRLKYTEPSKFPSVKRDVAFLLNKEIKLGEVLEDIKNICGKTHHSSYIFDIFEMDGKNSVAFSIELMSNEKTLEEEEINALFSKVIEEITNKYNAVLRDK